MNSISIYFLVKIDFLSIKLYKSSLYYFIIQFNFMKHNMLAINLLLEQLYQSVKTEGSVWADGTSAGGRGPNTQKDLGHFNILIRYTKFSQICQQTLMKKEIIYLNYYHEFQDNITSLEMDFLLGLVGGVTTLYLMSSNMKTILSISIQQISLKG